MKGTFGKNQTLFNNAASITTTAISEVDEEGRWGDKLPGKLEKQITSDIGPLARSKRT